VAVGCVEYRDLAELRLDRFVELEHDLCRRRRHGRAVGRRAADQLGVGCG
jgi:hypothetical protein